MNVDPYLSLGAEKKEVIKKGIQDHLEGKKQEEFGRTLFEKFSDLYKQQMSGPVTLKFPDLQEEVTNAVAEEEVKSLDEEILKDSSDDVKITVIKQDIELGRVGIRTMCEASKIYMPQTYKFLEAYTTSEFKRIMMIHRFLGLWLEFPTIGELGRNDPEVKKYFKTYLHLLEDRGVEQDKQFHYKEEEFLFLDKEGDNKLPRELQRVLDEDKEKEKYNEATPTLEIKLFDGEKWGDVI